jgi:hypothetical protein
MDPDGDALSYAWKVVASSNGSIPPITNSTRSVAQLGASTAGVYAIELKVSDGTLSDVDFVIVEIRGNQPPVADVSLSDRIIALGTTARLDGSKSTDPDGDALTYAWRVVATSSGTIPHIENATSAVASLMGQAVGHYAVEFAVRDAVAADIEYLLVNVRENPGLHMGDFNASGIVDQEDYLVWRATFGSTSDLRADANGDKTIDAADSVMWRRHQGQSVAATSAAMSEASAVSAAGDIDAEVAADHNVEDVRLLAAVDSALSLWPTAAALSTFHEPPGPVVTRLQSYLKNDLLLLVTVPAVFEAGDRDPDSDGSRRVDIEDAPPEFDRLFNELGGSYDNLEVS